MMAGLLFRLFVQKWEKFGRMMYMTNRALDGIVLLSLSALAFTLKVNARNELPPEWLIYAALLCPLPCLFEDTRVVIIWWQEMRARKIAQKQDEDAEQQADMARRKWTSAMKALQTQRRLRRPTFCRAADEAWRSAEENKTSARPSLFIHNMMLVQRVLCGKSGRGWSRKQVLLRALLRAPSTESTYHLIPVITRCNPQSFAS